eukprot:6269042-Alexandrium_andersonii.AAC.1
MSGPRRSGAAANAGGAPAPVSGPSSSGAAADAGGVLPGDQELIRVSSRSYRCVAAWDEELAPMGRVLLPAP